MNDNEWLDYAGYKHHTRKCGAVEYAGVSTLPHTYEADEGIATPVDKVTGALRIKERRLGCSNTSTTASATSLLNRLYTSDSYSIQLQVRQLVG